MERITQLLSQLSQEERNKTLIFAAQNNIVPLAQISILAGASLNANYGYSVLNDAIEKNYVQIAKLLIQTDAYVNFDIDHALSRAVVLGRVEIARLLIKAGADVNVSNGYPLELAAANGHTEVIKLLTEASTDNC